MSVQKVSQNVVTAQNESAAATAAESAGNYSTAAQHYDASANAWFAEANAARAEAGINSAPTADNTSSDGSTSASSDGSAPAPSLSNPGTQGVNGTGSPRQPNTNEFTLAPVLADIDLADTYNQLIDPTNTSLNSVFAADKVSPSEIQAIMDYRNAFKQGDVITAMTSFYNKLLTEYFLRPDFSLDAILFWHQKLIYSNKEITSYKSDADFYNHNIISNQIPQVSLFAKNVISDVNMGSNSYFDLISDSIGIIANSKFIQLDSTLPIFDINQQYYGVPIPFAASTDSKISANTRNVCYDLSHKTTVFMRRNLLNISYLNPALQQNLAADATVSHGLNLMNDLPTFVNINKFLQKLKNRLSTIFAETKQFSFVQYINTVCNNTSMSLRDIFPITKTDVDFTVITSEERAMASKAVAQQAQIDALASATLAHQQQTSNFGNSPATGGPIAATTTGKQFETGQGNPAIIADTKTSAAAARNAAIDASGMTIETYTENGNVMIDQTSYEAYCQQRIEGPPASPLLSINPADAAQYGITDPTDSKQWSSFMWRTACAENGDLGDNVVKAVQYANGPNDPGGSYGALSVSPDQARAAGYGNVTPDQLQNPALNANVGISLIERSTAKTGTIGGNYVGNGGAFAGRTMRLLRGEQA
jgi:hypothetical protein